MDTIYDKCMQISQNDNETMKLLRAFVESFIKSEKRIKDIIATIDKIKCHNTIMSFVITAGGIQINVYAPYPYYEGTFGYPFDDDLLALYHTISHSKHHPCFEQAKKSLLLLTDLHQNENISYKFANYFVNSAPPVEGSVSLI